MNKIITGKCTALSSEGKGIIKNGKDTIFVDALLLDEEADVEILYRRAGVSYGKIKKLHTFSPERIKPLCPISTSCGGCVFQNASYKYELAYKKQKVEETLKRIGHLDVKVNDVIGMKDPTHYRNKAQVPFQKINKKIVYGFYKANTHKITPLEDCNIQDIRSEKILKDIAYLMQSMNIAPYDEDNRSGVIRHILIRTSHRYDEVLLTIITNVDSFPNRNAFVKEIIKRNPNITSIVQNINKRKTNVILGEIEKILYGKGFIRDELLGLKFNIFSKSFYQVNSQQVEVLYKLAIESAHITNKDVVLDAYAGVATIGLLAAHSAKEVYSVEIVKEACKAAKMSASINNIDNIKIINADCTEYMNSSNTEYDVIIMDPPRKGSTPEFLNALLKLLPKRIVYISCEPATLARDLEILSKAYNIDYIQPVDMFPRTYHVETIVGIYRKDEK